MIVVRGSEVQEFLRCRRKWKYNWVENLEPKKQNAKLFFGNLFHKFVEVLYANKNEDLPADIAYDAMQRYYHETDTNHMDQIELQEIWETAQEVAGNYVKQWWQQDKEWKILGQEVNFLVKLDDVIFYEGTIDLIYEVDGKVYFMDHKTTSEISKYEKNAEMDRQISRYWWALQKLQEGVGRVKGKDGIWEVATYLEGKEIGGFVYNVILRDYPVAPEPLKKGGLSKAKNQKTTYELYMETLIENKISVPLRDTGIDEDGYNIPEEYEEILNHLKQQDTEYGNRFFRRVPVVRNQQEIEDAIMEFYFTAKDLVHTGQALLVLPEEAHNQVTYRNITSDCSWDCGYKELCKASMDGSDATLLKNLLYKVREDDVQNVQH